MQVYGGQRENEEKNILSIIKRGRTRDMRAERNNLLVVAILDTWGRGEVLPCAAAEGHAWVCGHAAAGICVNVHGPMLPLKTM